MAEPRSVTAGDTWTWTRSGDTYPASDGWTLTYYMACGAAAPEVVTAEADGYGYKATVTAATSDTWPAGTYGWTARVSKGTAPDIEVHTVGTGTVTVLPNPTATVDRRSWEEQMIPLLEAAIKASAGSLLVEYEMDGVKGKLSRSEAVKLLRECRSAVRIQRGGPAIRTVPVRFSNV